MTEAVSRRTEPRIWLDATVVGHISELAGVDAVLPCVPPDVVNRIAQDLPQRRLRLVECARLHGEAFLRHDAALHKATRHHASVAIVGGGLRSRHFVPILQRVCPGDSSWLHEEKSACRSRPRPYASRRGSEGHMEGPRHGARSVGRDQPALCVRRTRSSGRPLRGGARDLPGCQLSGRRGIRLSGGQCIAAGGNESRQSARGARGGERSQSCFTTTWRAQQRSRAGSARRASHRARLDFREVWDLLAHRCTAVPAFGTNGRRPARADGADFGRATQRTINRQEAKSCQSIGPPSYGN